jgi:hypothetical protein
MDLYEQLVETYLTVFERNFVLPQPAVKLGTGDVPIGLFETGSNWDAWPDFIALDFEGKRIQIVEVSKSTAVSDVRGKLKKYEDKHYEAWIRRVLPNTMNDFQITRRFFVRASVKEKLGATELEISTLEHVFDTIRDKMP